MQFKKNKIKQKERTVHVHAYVPLPARKRFSNDKSTCVRCKDLLMYFSFVLRMSHIEGKENVKVSTVSDETSRVANTPLILNALFLNLSLKQKCHFDKFKEK